MQAVAGISSRMILGQRVDATSYADAARRVLDWARAGESRYVCVSNVHMVMEAHDDAAYQGVVNGADLVTPDGVPLVWALRLLGVRQASRVYGPELTPFVCGQAAEAGIPVGFYGGSPAALEACVRNLRARFPALRVAYQRSPPFRAATAAEEAETVAAINASGARILFVGLGCPKQERWMAAHRGKVRAVMLGVGAAFDFVAGTKPQAPRWMMNSGLEWAFRFATEPRRLARRYLYHNPRYVAGLLRQVASHRLARGS
jgi:N-acetylglucosaminyldiphosphoundecaprenol N-acetyl-beta-D-mannosaminyltransferase